MKRLYNFQNYSSLTIEVISLPVKLKKTCLGLSKSFNSQTKTSLQRYLRFRLMPSQSKDFASHMTTQLCSRVVLTDQLPVSLLLTEIKRKLIRVCLRLTSLQKTYFWRLNLTRKRRRLSHWSRTSNKRTKTRCSNLSNRYWEKRSKSKIKSLLWIQKQRKIPID